MAEEMMLGGVVVVEVAPLGGLSGTHTQTHTHTLRGNWVSSVCCAQICLFR